MSDHPSHELYMFRKSHFNEKARWTLDLKALPHRRIPLLPGPHASTVKRLTGQTSVPVLVIDGQAFHDSSRIIDELERRHPEPALYPAAAEDRARALEIQSHFDEEVGPKIRRAFFSILINEPRYLSAIFAGHRSAPVRALYGAMLPLVRTKMVREMEVHEPRIAEAYEATGRAFEFVAEHSAATGYLVGDRFTVADLTAAALLAPAVDIPHPDMFKPEPRPVAIERWLARWAELPGAEWVRTMYRRHRPAASSASAMA